MSNFNDEFLEILNQENGDIEGRKKALDYLQNSGVDAHGEPLNFSYIPYFVDQEKNDFFKQIVSTTHTILTKIIEHYLSDDNYRKVFKYSKQLEELIMLPCLYSQLLPMARFDIFLDEESNDFKFCEFNTDGTSCMSRDLVLGQACFQGKALNEFAKKHNSITNYELFDSWAKCCLDNYFEQPNSKSNPTVAIADFMDNHATYSDFDRYLESFEKAGAQCIIADIRDLKLRGNDLIDTKSGLAIDVIYRRAVTCDIQNHIDECNDLIEAIKTNRVCLVGHFRTTVVHTKTVNIALFLPETREFLDDKEIEFIDKHCPKTYRLDDSIPIDIDEIKSNPNKWILKPEDDYGAKGVFAGPDFDTDEWKMCVDSHINMGYVAQEYAKQYTTDVLYTGRDLDNTSGVEKFNAMPGLYCYNGNFAGIYLRCGKEGVIAVDHNGLVKPAFKVDFD